MVYSEIKKETKKFRVINCTKVVSTMCDISRSRVHPNQLEESQGISDTGTAKWTAPRIGHHLSDALAA